MFIFDNDSPFWLDALSYIASWFILSILFVAVLIGTSWVSIADGQRKEKKQLQKYRNNMAEQDRLLFEELERLRNDFDN